MREERQEKQLDTILSAGAIQVVESPRVVALAWEPCADEFGARALEVSLELERTNVHGHGIANEAELRGARSIWEALVLLLYESGDERFPYVSFRNRSGADGGALG